jgi:hypothetical protein
MTNEEIEPWLEKKVTVTLIDGSKRTGTLMAGVGNLYHILGEPSPDSIGGGHLEDIYAEQIVKVEPA